MCIFLHGSVSLVTYTRVLSFDIYSCTHNMHAQQAIRSTYIAWMWVAMGEGFKPECIPLYMQCKFTHNNQYQFVKEQPTKWEMRE